MILYLFICFSNVNNSTLLLKMWRIDKIVNNRVLKRIKITQKDILLTSVLHLTAVLFFLAVQEGVGGSVIGYKAHEVSNQV